MSGPNKNIPLGYVLGFLGVVIFGATLPATVLALEAFSPWFITFGRAVLATTAAAVCVLALRREFPRKEVVALLTAGLLLIFGFPGFMAVAMQTVSASHGGVVLGILPLATAVFASILAGERPSGLFWFSALLGAVLVVWFVTGGSEFQISAGVWWLMLAGLSASLGYVISARLSAIMPGWEVICWALILTAPASLAGAALTWERSYAAAAIEPIIAFAYTGLGSMFLGFFAWNAGLAKGGIARVGQIQLLQIFVTVALSAWLLGETITVRTILFACAVALTVWLGRKARVA
ncbi:DMT family transporter [Oricola cellulosilytica]|uniref:DMT family transporter n=1 Tax=Oricola cellulosilytica TaxID=1429082 RepID=A0A4R0PAU0_9HYPH|nr:DMT family transporter [Oricola cellulosilytica]TCD14362.1 DMT family transporter [Oricola cellulosilytica]